MEVDFCWFVVVDDWLDIIYWLFRKYGFEVFDVLRCGVEMYFEFVMLDDLDGTIFGFYECVCVS